MIYPRYTLYGNMANKMAYNVFGIKEREREKEKRKKKKNEEHELKESRVKSR